MIYRHLLKPSADIIMALLLICFLAPVMLGLTICGAIVFGNPFFIQQRSGKNLRLFYIYKFRSMFDLPDLPEAERIPFYGRILRRYSLDELPQLFNILFGHMSFFGPRPLPINYSELIDTTFHARFSVKPGLSGLVQVNGRNHLSWDQKFLLDLQYARQVSFPLDMKILLKTFPAWWSGTGVNHDTNRSMPVFMGNKTNFITPNDSRL